MPIGYQAVQSAHAIREFVARFPVEDDHWFTTNNSIILVTVGSLKELNKLLLKADSLGIGYCGFREPDIGYQITAVAFVPSEETQKLLRHCQLIGGPTQPNSPPKSLLDYRTAMKQAKQGNGTVWDHCSETAKNLESLWNGNRDFPRLDRCCWLEETILYCKTNYKFEDVATYCQFHDIGKVNDTPNHSEESYRIWMEVDGRSNIGQWIRDDMAVHTLTQEEFRKIPDWQLHSLVGLAELYANMEMFGGPESDSFKIKHKKVMRNGKLQ